MSNRNVELKVWKKGKPDNNGRKIESANGTKFHCIFLFYKICNYGTPVLIVAYLFNQSRRKEGMVIQNMDGEKGLYSNIQLLTKIVFDIIDDLV